MPDIFDFWAECPPDARIHPADTKVFDRVAHQFELDLLPIAFTGKLRTAPVVLLYLSPGSADGDAELAKTERRRAWYGFQRTGWAPWPTHEEHAPAWDWWARIVSQFGVNPESVRDKIAVLNIGSYHSKGFNDWHMLTALPSSRATMDWAQGVLFLQAERGERVVVCMRSAAQWGLEPGRIYGKSLYAPVTVRGGHMRRAGDHETDRLRIAAAVKAAIGTA